jgi:flagellar biogenesis protein FliO
MFLRNWVLVAATTCALLASAPLCAEGDTSKLERTRALLQQGPPSEEQQTTPASGLGVRMFQGLALAIAVLCAGVYLAKRRGIGQVGSARSIRIIERCALSARSTLILVEVNGKKMLIGVGSETPTLLAPRTSGLGSLDPAEFNDAMEQVCDGSTPPAS